MADHTIIFTSQNYPPFLCDFLPSSILEKQPLQWQLPLNSFFEFPYIRMGHLERGFRATAKFLKGIICPGLVGIGPEMNDPYIHVKPRFPSGWFSRFFAYKSVLKLVLDVVRERTNFECLFLYHASTCKGEVKARVAKRRIARLKSLSSRYCTACNFEYSSINGLR